MKLLASIAGATLLFSSAAHADTVYNTTLAPLPGTTTDATGTRTTFDAGTTRESAPSVLNTWEQANIGGGGTVGITTDYAQSGNGSAFFSTTSGSSKADLVNYITSYTSPIPLSSLTGLSFDYYRSSSSTTGSNFAPVIRLDMKKGDAYAGSLVFENVYQNNTAAVVDNWTTLTANLNSGVFWTTGSNLGPTFASGAGSTKTLQAWIDANAGSTLGVYGIEIGVGSGWSGTFSGAVDNVNVAFNGGPQVSSNFEVVQQAVSAAPEPGAWALMLGGVAMLGAVMRAQQARRRNSPLGNVAAS